MIVIVKQRAEYFLIVGVVNATGLTGLSGRWVCVFDFPAL
jgi:hypothetical protein